MLLNIDQQKWLHSLNSKPPFQYSPKKPNYVSHSIDPSSSSTKTVTKEKNYRRTNSNNKNKSDKTSQTIGTKKEEKSNQTENFKVIFPGKTVKKEWANENAFSLLNPENIKVNGLFYQKEEFSQFNEKIYQENLLKEYLQKIKRDPESKKNTYENSIFYENLNDINEKKLEVKDEKRPKVYEKIINIRNEQIPNLFSGKLPGNNFLSKENVEKKKINSAICIQKFFKKYLKGKENKKTKLLNLIDKNIFEKCIKSYEQEENLDSSYSLEKTVKISRKPLNNELETTKTLRSMDNDVFKNDGFSVIGLFLKEKPQKIPEFKDTFDNEAYDTRKIETKTKKKNMKSYDFEKVDESINNGTKSFIKESIEDIIEGGENTSIMEESGLQKNKEISENDEYYEEKFESISEDKSLKNISINSKINEKNWKNKDHSYNYEDEKFESISEDKSLKKLSLEGTKNENITPFKKNEQNKASNSYNYEEENFESISDDKSLKKFSTDENKKQHSSSLKNSAIKSKKSVNFIKETPNKIGENKEVSNVSVNKKIIIDNEIDHDLVNEARNKIDAFNRHDGELSQVKHELLNVLHDLHTISKKKTIYASQTDNLSGNQLYNRFQSEFSRLMNLKNANEFLEVYEEINSKNRIKASLISDIEKLDGRKNPNQEPVASLNLAINDLKNKQEVIFQTLLTVLQNNNSNQGLKQELDKLKENQIEIIEKIAGQSILLEGISKRAIITSDRINIPKEKDLSPKDNTKNQETIKNLNNNKSVEEEEKEENQNVKKERILNVIKRSDENNFILKTPIKDKSDILIKTSNTQEDIEEYIDDFEESTPQVPNIPFQKSLELQKSQSPNRPSVTKNDKSFQNEVSQDNIVVPKPNNTKEKINENIGSLEQIRSMSMISSDREVELEDDFSSISWQNIISPQKFSHKFYKESYLPSPESNKDKILDNLTEFITQKVFEDTIFSNQIFPKRDMKELQKIIDKLFNKPNKLEEDKKSPPGKHLSNKNGLNMDNFEEKSPTKLKKLKKSTDDLLRNSLEMSVRNEGFITETEKDVRSLESKLRRRNNENKIKESISLLNEDIYNKINLFTENDVKEKGSIIIDAFNEQLKMSIIKEINDCQKKNIYFGDYKQLMGEQLIKKQFNKISGNTKKVLLKSIQNQLKENELYMNVKNYDFNQLFEIFKKEKYPFEEEENLEMLDFQINQNWDEFRKVLEEDVMNECVNDVISELTRLGNKKKK